MDKQSITERERVILLWKEAKIENDNLALAHEAVRQCRDLKPSHAIMRLTVAVQALAAELETLRRDRP